MKVIKSLAVLGLLSYSGIANSAEFKMGQSVITVSPSIQVASQKVGTLDKVTLNRDQPSGKVGILVSDSRSNLYASHSYETDKPDKGQVAAGEKDYNYEACSVIGWAPKLDKLGLDLSFENCYVDKKTDKNTGYFYATGTIEIVPKTNVFLTYGFADDGEGAQGATTGKFIAGHGYIFGITNGFKDFDLKLAVGGMQNYQTWYQAGISRAILGATVDLSVYSVQAENSATYVTAASQRSIDRTHAILTISKSF